MIYFNNPSISSIDKTNVIKAINKNHFISNGKFYEKICDKIKSILNSKNVHLTQSGSDALEVASLLLEFKNGDEVLMPSYTFSSTANSVVLGNGKPVFVDINQDDLCIDLRKAEKSISKKTKAIFVVHYGGNSCDMEFALYLKKKYNLFIIEDAAHAFLSKFKKKFCGTIGDIGIFSFHQTKNFTSGQGGALIINNKKFIERAEIILNKGNTRNLSKENYYLWKDVGSEYKMNELSSALLYGQILNRKEIIRKRKYNFSYLEEQFSKIHQKIFRVIKINEYSEFGYHIFALIFQTTECAILFKQFMLKNRIEVMSHYFPLHLSDYGKNFKFSDCKITEKIYSKLIRIPIHTAIKKNDLEKISKAVFNFCKKFDKWK